MTDSRKIGIVGLGRMGLPLCQNLKDKGYEVHGHDKLESNRQRLIKLGMPSAETLDELCRRLLSPRYIIMMVPAGEAVDEVIFCLLPFLSPGDVLIDAGNSRYQDSMRRSISLKQRNIVFFDVGMSGGTYGARKGACLTIGGDCEQFVHSEFLFSAIAQTDGYMYVGPAGWGHLVKTIHNGIEYGFLQAIAEGLHTINAIAEQQGVDIDLVRLCEVWGNGSIISSRLLNDAATALPCLHDNKISGKIGGGETGQWSLQLARQHQVETPVLAAALAQRTKSFKSPDFSSKIIAAIRNVFGGHEFL